MQQKIKMTFTLFCLFATSIVTIATSKENRGSDPLIYQNSTRTYLVASNCPQSVPSEKVTIANKTIFSPSDLRFYDFGLPTSSLDLDSPQPLVGSINGHQRTCTRSEIVDRGTPLIMYSCSENGSAVCQVTFEIAQ